MVRFLSGLAVGAFVVAAGIVGTAAPAGAICAGPEVEIAGRETAAGWPPPTVVVPREAAAVTIVGRWWGDDCNDTGGRERVLGDPIDDITVSFEHGGVQQVLARVTADDCYRFKVPVVLPYGDDPGAATLRVAGSTRHEEVVVERVISPGGGALGTVPEVEASTDEPCRFGGGSFHDDGQGSWRVPIVVAGVAAVAGSAVVVARRRIGAA